MIRFVFLKMMLTTVLRRDESQARVFGRLFQKSRGEGTLACDIVVVMVIDRYLQ